ncbi:MAG: hypothetical protein V3R99_00455, partial [Thermoguttaceae bacterium]
MSQMQACLKRMGWAAGFHGIEQAPKGNAVKDFFSGKLGFSPIGGYEKGPDSPFHPTGYDPVRKESGHESCKERKQETSAANEISQTGSKQP